ncbi:MAG: FHA domain-containing protein [Kiritimatiellia bacterium]
MGKRFVLPATGATIGRDAVADICIDDESLSRLHCRLVYDGNALILRDLGSLNGTMVNDQCLDGRCSSKIIVPGDTITLGNTLLVMEETAEMPEPAEAFNVSHGNEEAVDIKDEVPEENRADDAETVRQEELRRQEAEQREAEAATETLRQEELLRQEVAVEALRQEELRRQEAAAETVRQEELRIQKEIEMKEFHYFDVRSEGALSIEQKETIDEEEARFQLGNFMCPYCRTILELGNILSVSVSPTLVGDPVLGENEQLRFLPTQFTKQGLAIDTDGGICTEVTCPHCHMILPPELLHVRQTVMSIVGATGAGKSFFLASSIWQCRQILNGKFAIHFVDMDPTANRWINAYEEKLFFQTDVNAFQVIEKTRLQSKDVSRSISLNGENKLLPLPSFFRVSPPHQEKTGSLVVYDCAGEHFRAGADTNASLVTHNIISADTLLFLYDPSADPRFRNFLDKGKGTATNDAQRQDTLLMEMSVRIRRYLGNQRETKLSRPLIFGISKADLLHAHLPLETSLYSQQSDGQYALDVEALNRLSQVTETFLKGIVPEVVATVKDIAREVWFIPLSALGHNPVEEGIRPSDVQPIFSELPIVFTLAYKGLLPIVGGTLTKGQER